MTHSRKNYLLPDVERWPDDRPVIELLNVSKSCGDDTVIQDLSLSIQTGKTTVISGESGSGKTILLRMMNGLTFPDSGRVMLFGQDLMSVSERVRTELRKRCTMVFQNYALIDSMTVGDNIGFPLAQNTRMKPRDIRALVVDLLEMLELGHAIELLPDSLSGGMKKRVALARAVITNPEVVLFDEPTTGLDPIMIEFVDELIQRTQVEYGLTSVIISHDMASNRRLADRMAILSEGKIVEEGTFEEVCRSEVPSVRAFMGDIETERGIGQVVETVSAPDVQVEPIVTVEGLHRSFGDNHVLKGVDCTFPERQITVVIGGSGSGKSVLIKHIIGLLRPDEGRIRVFGEELTTMTTRGIQAVQARIGMLFQGAALFDSMTVYENIAFPLVEARSLRRAEIKDAVMDVARRLSIEDILEQRPDAISNGQKKRVGLARALVTKPDIMIYDEPTTGQDPIMMRRVDDMIVEASEKFEITSIVISHDMRSTFRIADQVIMIKDGEVLIAGSPAELAGCGDRVSRHLLERVPRVCSLFWDESKRERIDAMPLTGRWWSVGEDMA